MAEKSNVRISRNIFLNFNKYQQKLLLPALLACLLACVVTFYTIFYISYVDTHIAAICSIDLYRLEHDLPWFMNVYHFNRYIPWFLFGMTTVLMSIVCWLYVVSNQLLGPTDRVLRELDDILSGKRKDAIGTRPGDEIFEELLKRINTLISKMN